MDPAAQRASSGYAVTIDVDAGQVSSMRMLAPGSGWATFLVQRAAGGIQLGGSDLAQPGGLGTAGTIVT